MSVTNIKSNSGYLGKEPEKPNQDFVVAGNRVQQIYNVVVYRFQMSDVEDPEIYVAEPIWKWQQTEVGKWVMKHAVEAPRWHQQLDSNFMGYRFAITSKLKEKDYTYWCLKYADYVDNKL